MTRLRRSFTPWAHEVADDALLKAAPLDLAGEVMRRRAEELVARPGPRRPLSEEIDEMRERDLKLLRGERPS